MKENRRKAVVSRGDKDSSSDAKQAGSGPKSARLAKSSHTYSEKKLSQVPMEIQIARYKPGAQSAKLLLTNAELVSKSNFNKLEIAIEKKFSESGMKRYCFPNRGLNDELTNDESLCSLKGVHIYDLHSQNKKDSTSLQCSPILSKLKTQRTQKPTVVVHSEYSNTRVGKAFDTLSSRNVTSSSQSSEKLQGLLKKLRLQKERLRDPSSSVNKVLVNENCFPLSLKKSKFSERMPTSKQAVIFKYLKASKPKIQSFKKKHQPDTTRPSLLDLKSSLMHVPTGVKERNTSLSSKSLSNVIRNKQETSADKFKQLKLSCLGNLTQSPETRIKNSKKFLFGESVVKSSKAKEMSAEAYNLTRKLEADRPLFEIPLTGQSFVPGASLTLRLAPKTTLLALNSLKFSKKVKGGGTTERLHRRSLAD